MPLVYERRRIFLFVAYLPFLSQSLGHIAIGVVTLLYVKCIWEWWEGELRLEGGRRKDCISSDESRGPYSFYYLVRSSLVLVPISDEFILATAHIHSLPSTIRFEKTLDDVGMGSFPEVR